MRWKKASVLILLICACRGLCFKIDVGEGNVNEELSKEEIQFQPSDKTDGLFLSEENNVLTPEEAKSEGVILEDSGDGVKIVEDLSLFDEINAKHPLDGDDVVGEFEPINVPTDFSSYDVSPKDGFIQLKEIIFGTGAEENAKEAFEDADIDGDGLLSWDEFHNGPWNLDAEDEFDTDEIPSIPSKNKSTDKEFIIG